MLNSNYGFWFAQSADAPAVVHEMQKKVSGFAP
jgi:hypothetical protein